MKNKKAIFSVPYSVLLERSQDIFDSNRMDEVALSTLEETMAEFRSSYRSTANRYFNTKKKEITREYLGYYKMYMQGGYKETNRVGGYNPYDFKAKYRRQLSNKINTSLNLIKNHNSEHMQEICSRFLNWYGVDSQEMRGKSELSSKLTASLKKQLDIGKNERTMSKHTKFVIRDQANKLTASMDEITAEEGGAIGGQVLTREDKRVVGDPVGLYPKGNKMHENHFKRNKKIYLYENSWAIENGFIIKGQARFVTELTDGLPGVPVGCRCTWVNIYDLDEIPLQWVSKSGILYKNSF